MTNKKSKKLLSFTQNKFYFILGISLVFFIVNLLIGLFKPLWLDEVASLNLLNAGSIGKIIHNFYIGADTNPPLYFLIIYLLRDFSKSDILIKVFSLVLCLGGLLVLFKLLERYVSYQTLIISFFVLSISYFFSQYLIVEIRPYSLFFFLTSLFIYQYHKIVVSSSNTLFSYVKVTIISVALLYTHYFWLFYICIILMYTFFISDKRIKIGLIISLSLSIIFFIPWLGAIHNQMTITRGTFWQEIPDLFDILTYPKFYIGHFLFLLLVLGLIFSLVFKKNIYRQNIIKNRNFFFLILLLAVFPLLNYILVVFNYSVSEPRYYIPTYISFIIVMSIIIDSLDLVGKKALLSILVMVISFYGSIKIAKYYNLEKNRETELNYFLGLNTVGLPIACESPHMFFPLNYYAEGKGNSNFYFILDQKSAHKKGNVKNALFDYYGMHNLKTVFHSLNIIDINKFKKKYKDFYFINEQNRMIFENRFKYNINYSVHLIKNNVYEIKRLNQ